MNQRVEPKTSLDDFPTPPWAVRAFCNALAFSKTNNLSVWEPAANRGHMVHGLKDYFDTIYVSDIHDYGVGIPVSNFLGSDAPPFSPDWIITNPPFKQSEEFVHRSLKIATKGFALITRTNWAEGVRRWNSIFSITPPDYIMQHVERVPMVKGRYDPNVSSAATYSWFVWKAPYTMKTTQFMWIPQCKSSFFRPGDEIIRPLKVDKIGKVVYNE